MTALTINGDALLLASRSTSPEDVNFSYQPGAENLGDYPSKAQLGTGHQHVRPYYLHQDDSPRVLPRASKPSARRGCAEILGDPYDKKVPLHQKSFYVPYGTHYIPTLNVP